jgi:hypothetical protein
MASRGGFLGPRVRGADHVLLVLDFFGCGSTVAVVPNHDKSSSPSLLGAEPSRALLRTMVRKYELHEMDDYDRRDDASVSAEGDPPTRFRPWRALQRETNLVFERLEARNTGGVEHRGPADLLNGARR